MIPNIESLLSRDSKHSTCCGGLPLHWPTCLASAVCPPLSCCCLHGWQRLRAARQYGFEDEVRCTAPDQCCVGGGRELLLEGAAASWLQGTLCCCLSSPQMQHFLQERDATGTLRWSWESPADSWNLRARPTQLLLPTKVVVIGTNEVDHLCLVQVLVGRCSTSPHVHHTEPSTPLSISTVAVPVKGKRLPAAVEFWDVPWDLRLVTVGSEYLFEGVSVVLLAYNPLQPQSLVAAARRFKELCPPGHGAKCTVIPVIALPDESEGKKRRRGLTKIGEGLFNEVLSKAQIRLPFTAADVNMRNRAGCTQLLREIAAIGEQALDDDDTTVYSGDSVVRDDESSIGVDNLSDGGLDDDLDDEGSGSDFDDLGELKTEDDDDQDEEGSSGAEEG